MLIGAVIVIGLIGILLPVVPGAWLVLAAVFVWATEEPSGTAWIVLGVASAAIVVSQVVKYTLPGRRLVSAGVPRSSIVIGSVVGVVGFFVLPVLGLFLGFVVGLYGAELRRLGDCRLATASTRAALRAVGLSVLIELSGALVAASAWGVGVLFTS